MTSGTYEYFLYSDLENRTYITTPHAKNYVLQIESHETITWTKQIKKGSHAYSICSICGDNMSVERRRLHEQFHRGGIACPDCEHLQFTLTKHTCKPKESIFIVRNARIAKSFGIAKERVFLNEIILWLGIGSKLTAQLCAEQQHQISLKAKTQNYTLPNGNSCGCPSYCDKIFPTDPNEPVFTPLLEQAFFLDTLGGSFNAIRKLRNLCRIALKTTAHCKGANSI